MFERARVTLTAWYLLIIMAISLAFSLVIYKSITFELSRAKDRQEKRMIVRSFEQAPPFVLDDDIFEDIKGRVRITLFLINIAILLGAGGVGYYLAGKTLSPIAEMLDIQTRFISDASHELKTPITAMRLALEVRLREKSRLDKATKIVLSENLDEVIKLQKLTEGLLELSKSPKQNKLTSTPLAEIIEGAIAEVKQLAKVKKIKLVVQNSKKIIVQADKLKLQRSIVALIDNGIKYSPAASNINIKTYIKKSKVEIVIRDYGVGIDPKDLPHIKDRFYRGDKSRSSDGYGLGLAIAQTIIKEHGGDLMIAPTQSGKGTRVLVSLPYSASLQK